MRSAAARNDGTPVNRQENPAREDRSSAWADESNRLSYSTRQEAPAGRVEALLRTHSSLVHEIE